MATRTRYQTARQRVEGLGSAERRRRPLVEPADHLDRAGAAVALLRLSRSRAISAATGSWCARSYAHPFNAIVAILFLIVAFLHLQSGPPGGDRGLCPRQAGQDGAAARQHPLLLGPRPDRRLRGRADRLRRLTGATSMAAYTFIDHTYDVVVVGAGGSGLRATLGMAEQGLAHRLHHQGLPDALAHRRGAGRHRRLARQHGAGQLAVAPLRHRQGVGLARRHRRDGVSRARGAEGGLRARALRRAVQPHRGRADLPAAVRWPHHRVRRGSAGAAHLRRRRPDRPRDPAHALRAVA